MIETEDYKAVYNCDDTTVQFDFTFPIFQESDLDVKRYNGTTLSEETLIIGTDYYMEQATFGTWLDGGSVITYTTAYPTGDRISLTRDVSATQLLDYIENDPFPAESHERGLDKLTVLSQQLEELLSRSMLIPKSDPTGLDLELASLESRLGKFIQYDEVTGTPNLVSAVSASLVTFTAWGESWVANNDSDEGLDQLGFSTFTKSLVTPIDKAAWLIASGILLSDIPVGTLGLGDLGGDLDDIADGTVYQKIPNKGFILLSLTNYDATGAPQVTDGSVVEVGGTLFTVSGDTTPTGSPVADSFNYIYMEDDGDIVVNTTAPTWSDADKVFKNGTDRAIAGYYLEGANYLMKWVYTNQHAGPVVGSTCVAFAGWSEDAAQLQQWGAAALNMNGPGTTDDCYLQIFLPKNSIVTGLYSYCNIYNSNTFTIRLVDSLHTAQATTTMAENNHTGTGALTDTSITNRVVDNNTKMYGMRIRSSDAGDAQVSGCRVDYLEVMRT